MPHWRPSLKIQALHADHLKSRPALGAERAIHYTEFFKREAGSDTPACLLNASALADHLQRRSIRIHPGELIVGSHTEHRIGAICHIEKAGSVMLEDLFRFETRAVNPLQLHSGAKWALLRSAIPYWLNRNLAMRAFPLREKLKYAGEQLGAAHFVINEAAGVAHFLPDYEQIIQLGTDGLRAKVKARMDRGGLDERGRDYLEASLVCLDAIECFRGSISRRGPAPGARRRGRRADPRSAPAGPELARGAPANLALPATDPDRVHRPGHQPRAHGPVSLPALLRGEEARTTSMRTGCAICSRPSASSSRK